MDKERLIGILNQRFVEHMNRHKSVLWSDIIGLLNDEILDALMYLEETGGEPDVVVLDNQVIYVDCVDESPIGRRHFCYDKAARIHRKKFPPVSSVEEELRLHGLCLLSESMYIDFQTKVECDCKSSSWLLTDSEIRLRGGALFGLKRYGRVFIYHNGADAYYKDRGFRAYIALDNR